MPRDRAESVSTLSVLQELLAEMRGLRADLRRAARVAARPRLKAALDDYFGAGVFTVAGLLILVNDDPRSAIADAISDLVDMNADPKSRATQLGMALSSMDGVEVDAESKRRGAAVYRLRTSSE